jgi:hypothetical protein
MTSPRAVCTPSQSTRPGRRAGGRWNTCSNRWRTLSSANTVWCRRSCGRCWRTGARRRIVRASPPPRPGRQGCQVQFGAALPLRTDGGGWEQRVLAGPGTAGVEAGPARRQRQRVGQRQGPPALGDLSHVADGTAMALGAWRRPPRRGHLPGGMASPAGLAARPGRAGAVAGPLAASLPAHEGLRSSFCGAHRPLHRAGPRPTADGDAAA